MLKKGQVFNSKNIIIISLVLIALVAIVSFNKTTGYVWWFNSDETSSEISSVSHLPPSVIGVYDNGPASDTTLASKVITSLQSIRNSDGSYKYGVIPSSYAKLFSEININNLDNKVTLLIYNGKAVIILGSHSPASHLIFVNELTNILGDIDVDYKNFVSDEVNVDSLIKLFTSGATETLTTQQKQEVLDMLSNAEVISPYQRQGAAVGPFLADKKTPNQFCKEKGYGNCILVINHLSEVYFNSKDLTCSGGINYVDSSNSINRQADCNTVFDENFYRNFDPRPKSAQCITGGYGGSDHWTNYYLEFVCVNP